MIGSLETWRWSVGEDAAPLRERMSPGMGPGAMARLRDRWTPEQIGVCAELTGARSKAEAKFPANARRLAADRSGVEMASSAAAAAHKAERFVRLIGHDARVLDACCGIGGDAMGLAAAGLRVTAVDTDERRAWMAGHNAGCEAACADALSATPGDFDAVHADPARRDERAGGRRTRDTDRFEPALSDLFGVFAGVPAAIKLHPGVDPSDLPEGEVEIVSESGRLTQGVLWTGALARTPRRATLLRAGAEPVSIAGAAERPDDTTEPDAWIHTFDPAVERADLVGALARETGLSPVHPGVGLLTGPERVGSAWLRPFRVVESMPWNYKQVRRRLRELDAGEVTVKTRDALVEPDRLARDLRGRGQEPYTLFALRFGDRATAIITQRENAT